VRQRSKRGGNYFSLKAMEAQSLERRKKTCYQTSEESENLEDGGTKAQNGKAGDVYL